MKYIESLDGAGEGIFQNNRIAQLKPNCPPFVTVCPGLQLRLAAHLLTEDTTGRLFSQLVTTIGARHPARRRSGKTYFFHLAKTETERQALAAFSRALGHRGSTAPFWPDTSKTGDAASRPTIGWSLQSKSKNWTKRLFEAVAPGAGMKLLLRPHGASDGSRPVSLRKTLINWQKPRGTPAPTEPLLQNIIEISGIGQM